MSDSSLSPKFPTVALQLSKSSASVHSGGALRHLELAPSIYTLYLSIYLVVVERAYHGGGRFYCGDKANEGKIPHQSHHSDRRISRLFACMDESFHKLLLLSCRLQWLDEGNTQLYPTHASSERGVCMKLISQRTLYGVTSCSQLCWSIT